MAIVMTPDQQRVALAALLQSVPGVGQVHQYRRIIRDEAAVRSLLVPAGSLDGKTNAWMIYPAAASTTVTTRNPGHHGIGVQGGGNVFTVFQWQIDAYYSIDDAAESEKTFFDLAWAVADEINSYGLLDIEGIVEQLPADVDQFGFVMLAGTFLYHYARIQVAFRGRTRPT